ncbi:MAG: cyclic nucleotide-binding domain-containing protein [Myxococcota bacterium]
MATPTLLDKAYGKRVAGDQDGALRQAIALLEQDPGQIGAAALAALSLIDQDRGFLAGEAAIALADAYVRRGDLPMAIVCARAAQRGGEEGLSKLADIANAFGKGGSRLADVTPTPPPLPSEVEVDKKLAKLSGDALLDRAEAALQGTLNWDDPVEDDKLPELPLFADLEPGALANLLTAFEVREVAAGDEIIGQGDEGAEAFVVARGMLRVLRHDGEEHVVLAGLGPGAIFGEMALVSQAPRAAAVEAAEAAILLVISRDALEKAARKTPIISQQLSSFCRQRMLANLMRHSPILRAVATAERQALLERFHAEHFDAGEALMEEGDEAKGLFLIASGLVEVLGEDADGDALRIAELGPGNVVGEISLVLRRPANATVRAVTPTVALELTYEEFQEAIREHPTLLSELYETATQREEETRSVVAQEALDVEDIVLL